MTARAPALLAALALPAAAQDMSLAFDPAPVDACYASAPPGEAAPACLGEASGGCMDASEHGFTTMGMAECTMLEEEAWDRWLNVAYRALRADLAGRDAEAAESALGAGASREGALVAAQRAWIAFRDAECGLRWTLDQEGTIRSLSYSGCQLSFTAARALELRDMAGGPGGRP